MNTNVIGKLYVAFEHYLILMPVKDNTITNHNYVCHNILNMIVKHKIEGDLFLDSSLL